jgi:hypothetical protein
MITYNFIGWIRDTKGLVLRYNLKQICNTITSFSGGGIGKDSDTGMYNTTPYVLIEYEF